MRFRLPSPFPIAVGGAMPAVGTLSPAVPELLPELLPDLLVAPGPAAGVFELLPHAANARVSAAIAATVRIGLMAAPHTGDWGVISYSWSSRHATRTLRPVASSASCAAVSRF